MLKTDKLADAIGMIDDEKIANAKAVKRTTEKHGIKALFFKAPLAACLVLCLLFGTAAYAVYEAYQWSSAIRFGDGTKISIAENAAFKEIPNTAPTTVTTEDNNGSISMTHEEVEKTLGFNILNYDKATSDVMVYRTMQNKDGTIGRVDLWWADFLRVSDEKYMTLSISMLNKGADEGFVFAFEEGRDAAGGKELESIITENLFDTKIVVYKYDSCDDRITVTFVYDNVLYSFGGFNFTEGEMLSVIKQME